MTSSGPRFCPRCGTGRAGDMGFCPNCGLDLRQLPSDQGTVGVRPVDPDEPPFEPHTAEPRTAEPHTTDRSTAEPRYQRPRESALIGRLLLPGLLVLLLVLGGAWLLGLGPFGRAGDESGPFAGGPTATATPSSPFLPAVTAQPSFSMSPGLTAPPVGLTILSPADGAVVGAKNVTVIGTAPPGLRITQDISLGFDRHATTDGTGHWAIDAELAEGENQLKFRIGDDPSTTQTIRVIYLAPAAP
jgi:hypothetical protein